MDWDCCLEEVEEGGQAVVVSCLGGHSGEVCELVGILAHGGDSDGAGPIVVEMTQLIWQTLILVSTQVVPVLDDIVIGRAHNPLTSNLSDEEKVPADEKEINY